MMQDWYWVRHGPTHQTAFTGWRDVDVDLSDTGLIARVDAMLPVDAVVVSSDLKRAVHTADAIGGNRKRLPHDPDIREFDFGDWDGKHWTEVAETHPELSRTYWEKPGDVCAPNGESWNLSAARAHAAVDRLQSAGPAVIAVAHFGLILTQVQRASGQTPYQTLAQKIDNLSVTHIRIEDGQWSLKSVNVVP